METLRELHAEFAELRNELGDQGIQFDRAISEVSDIGTMERVSKYTKTIERLRAEKVPPPLLPPSSLLPPPLLLQHLTVVSIRSSWRIRPEEGLKSRTPGRILCSSGQSSRSRRKPNSRD